jgi:hypothetical protein
MVQPDTLARLGGLAFLLALATVIAYKILAGTISLRWLLTGERSDGTVYFSLGRVQLLALTVAIPGNYVWRMLCATASAAMPDVSGITVAILAVSQLLYLLDKAHGFRSRFLTSAK